MTTLDPHTDTNKPVSAASVTIDTVGHVFDNGFRALAPSNLHVEAGTFCTLLGPSGSGKTTLLRILAGLITPSEGRVLLGGRDVTAEPIQKRDIGFVFQHYALFPHMSVAQNIGYPLRIRGMKGADREARVDKILDLIGLAPQRDRRPDQLSGGQQQRVAVGRALVYEPKVLLLDEPLGALDRRLRQQLGGDLRRIQQETGTTAIYVTHDQEEAFLLSDQVVVMDHGRIMQEGGPEVIYESPREEFVATFLGDTNLVSGIAKVGPEASGLDVDGKLVRGRPTGKIEDGKAASFSIRPEDVQISTVGSATERFIFGDGIVRDRVFLGARYRTSVQVGMNLFIAESERNGFVPEIGQNVTVGWDDGLPVLLPAPCT